MKRILAALLLALTLALPATAQITTNNLGQTVLPAQSVIGKLLSAPGTPNAIPFAQLGSAITISTGITALTGDVTATGPGATAAVLPLNRAHIG